MEQWQNKVLADPTFNKMGPIDILLGAEEVAKILLDGVHKTANGFLGQNTEFGWIVSGGNPSQDSNIKIVSMTARYEEDEIYQRSDNTTYLKFKKKKQTYLGDLKLEQHLVDAIY
ncbi:unnamed protein product [Brassicogethes aeneus]|uniref:Uncharacterized protein n=1 Tax=Brassicogethes aeneus TaxID=1431903 RepID=A0A9P0B0E4_BRAAE|nr:unnamed protein product [Brassicogethes aeneus]